LYNVTEIGGRCRGLMLHMSLPSASVHLRILKTSTCILGIGVGTHQKGHGYIKGLIGGLSLVYP